MGEACRGCQKMREGARTGDLGIRVDAAGAASFSDGSGGCQWRVIGRRGGIYGCEGDSCVKKAARELGAEAADRLLLALQGVDIRTRGEWQVEPHRLIAGATSKES